MDSASVNQDRLSGHDSSLFFRFLRFVFILDDLIVPNYYCKHYNQMNSLDIFWHFIIMIMIIMIIMIIIVYIM